MTVVGTPVPRVDGPAKVSGAARYSAEISLAGTAYLAVVGATIASGRVVSIDAGAARAAAGVLAVLTAEDLPKIAAQPHLLPSLGPLGAKGVGEIGQVGAAAAIANAVFHATGRRIRALPMAPELVMDPVGPGAR